MSVVIILVIIGVIVAGGFVGAFIWSVKSGQYEDTYSPAVRILFDDTKPVENEIVQGKKVSEEDPKEKQKNTLTENKEQTTNR